MNLSSISRFLAVVQWRNLPRAWRVRLFVFADGQLRIPKTYLVRPALTLTMLLLVGCAHELGGEASLSGVHKMFSK